MAKDCTIRKEEDFPIVQVQYDKPILNGDWAGADGVGSDL